MTDNDRGPFETGRVICAMAHGDHVSADLKQHIERRTGHRVPGLCVTPVDGRLLVRGCVRSYHVKQLILAAVMDFLADKSLKAAFDLCVI